MHTKNTMMILLLATSVAAAGACSAQPKVEDETEPGTEAAVVSETARQQPAGSTFSGRVAETMNAGPYTYVRVEAEGQEIWAAANTFEVEIGDTVVVPLDMAMEDFHSDTLDRDFPLIYFASMIAREGEDLAPSMPPGHPPISGAAAAHGGGAVAPAPVDPAPGGVTIDQIWADTQALSGSTVTVRGTVVKFNGGILGTNWIHIQDGTGDPSTGTHDITVTSPATASVGDVIIVTGPVVLDQDFGAGYNYPVMIKDATVVVQ